MSIILAQFTKDRKQHLDHLLVLSSKIHTSLIINSAYEDKLRVIERDQCDRRATSGLLKSIETTGARSLPGAESALKRHLIGQTVSILKVQ